MYSFIISIWKYIKFPKLNFSIIEVFILSTKPVSPVIFLIPMYKNFLLPVGNEETIPAYLGSFFSCSPLIISIHCLHHLQNKLRIRPLNSINTTTVLLHVASPYCLRFWKILTSLSTSIISSFQPIFPIIARKIL